MATPGRGACNRHHACNRGPWLTRVLAEQGADVISIRNPTI